MDQLNKILKNAISKVTSEQDFTVELSRTSREFGDYSCNIAMQLSKKLQKNPRDIALAIAENLKTQPEFKLVEVAGPGFINVTLSDKMLWDICGSPFPNIYDDKVVIETNNPNPFKAMHVGHAFNSIIGDTIANLLQAGGAETHRVSYHGDVGAHVGKSMYSILAFVDDDIAKLNSIKKEDRNKFMSKMYADGAKAYKEDSVAKIKINDLAKRSFIKQGDLFDQVYDTIKLWSFEQIDQTVKRLGNKPVEKRYLESDADSLGVQTVKKNVGKIFIESDGALVFPGSQYGSFDNVFVASNGSGLYGARDLGLVQLKDNDFHADKSYMVTAEEQRDYFKGVLKAVAMCLPKLKDVTVNISTGTLKLPEGKMSSRSGDIVDIDWLFERVEQALPEQSSTETLQKVLIAAIRYQFLKVKIGGDVIFDINEAVSLTGNTGPYLQYAYARACSILTKVKSQTIEPDQKIDLDADEHSLLVKIVDYKNIFTRSVSDLAPHMICNYLYELSQEFNRFYENNRVIGDQRQSTRTEILKKYKQTFSHGLNILGMPIIEKM